MDPIAEATRQWRARGLAHADEMAAATSIMRAQQLVGRSIDRALRPFGLTFARYEVLMLLTFSRTGSLPMTKVGDRLMVHPTGVTKLVDRLETDGLVERAPHPDDRRSVLASITPDGIALARRATDAITAIRFGIEMDHPADLTAKLTDFRTSAGDVAVEP